MSSALDGFRQDQELSVIKNPFLKDSIHSVSMHMSTGYKGDKDWWGHVCFKNETTEGKVSAKDCDTFEELIAQIKQILDSVNDK